MNTLSHKTPHGLKFAAYRLSLLLVIVAMLLGACRPQPTGPTSTPAPATKPPATEKAATQKPEVSQPTLTPTSIDSGLPVIDDGAPLPPQLIDQQPGGMELPTNGEIALVFDQPMDAAKTAAAWQMTDEQGQIVVGKLSWPARNKLVFKPEAALQPGSSYQASLSVDAVSAEGVALVEPLTFQFNTAGELQISQVSPVDGSTEIANDAVITVIFTRPVAPLVIAEEQDKLPNPISIEPQVEGTGEWINTSVYAFRPKIAFQGATTYTVTVAAGLADALDETQLAQDYSWSFTTTAPDIDYYAMSSGYYNQNNLKNVLLDEYFIIRFLQPMDQDSTEAALSLTNNKTGKSDLETSWDEDFVTMMITPTQRLALGSDYVLRIGAGAQALGGGELRQELEWNFSTVSAPKVISTTPANGATQNYYSSEFRIKFASPMDIESVKSRITVIPAPEKEIEWWYNEWDWSMSGYFLQPSTRYEIRLQAGMQDIYGNAISQTQTIRFTTAARSPLAGLQMPYEPVLFREGGPQDFYAYYTNIKSLKLELYQVAAEQFTQMLTGKTPMYRYQPDAEALVWEVNESSQAGRNERVLKNYAPTTQSGNPLPPGFYFLGLDSPEVRHDGRYNDTRLLMVTNANLTFKSTTTDSLIWLTGLEDGKPLADVSVSVFNENFEKIGQGSTDADGLLHLELPAPDDPYTTRFVLSDDGKVFAFSTSQWGSGVSMYDYGIWGAYYFPSNQPRAYVYTERPIYRPGQPVYFKGIVRLDDDLAYSLPDDSQVQVRITNYEETIYDEKLPLSSLGSFDGQITLDQETTLGSYSIDISLAGSDNVVGSVSFTVAEYRKPEFQVQVSAKPLDVLAGEEFTVQVQADYYSGGGVADAQVNWTLTAEPYAFNPPGKYSGYSFYDSEIDAGFREGYDGNGSEQLASGEGHTDSTGRFTFSLPADLGKITASRRLVFEATVTDLSLNAVSGRVEIVAHRSKVYPGIKPGKYVGQAGKEQTFEVVALDWDGEPLAGQKVSVEIVERRWYSVQEQDANGRIEWTSTVEDIPVTSFKDLELDEKGQATVTFTPPNGGIFRARVTAEDDLGNQGSASAYMWVAGKDYIPWRQTNDRSFELVTDRKSYAPGDTAEILIASPFQGQAYALVTVERGRIHEQEVVRLESNSTIYKLPITPGMAPNVYVSVLVVKGVDDTNPRPNFKLGITEISVSLEKQTLTVELEPDREQAGPGETINYTVRTLDDQGKPVSAEVSLSLSDLATLSLLPPNSAPILDYFYSERTLGVWTAVPIALSIEEYNATLAQEIVEGGLGGSGGGGKGADIFGVIDVRQDFPDTAYWKAAIQTDANGEAQVSVRLPDNLTTWRMEARAFTKDTRVGQATIDIISTKSLLVRPQTPRFFVVGDQVTLGTAVHNNTDKSLSVDVSLAGEGLMLKNPANQRMEIPAQGRVYVTWQASINPDAQRVDLVFSAEGGGLSDASRPPQGTLEDQGLPVYRYEAPETVGTSGQLLDGGSQVEAISLPEAFQVSQGELTIKLSPSLAAGMTDSLEYLKNYPYDCLEQTISKFLPNVITTRALKSAGLSDKALEDSLATQVDTALQRLYNWQNPDGGWGWWNYQKSDPLTSAYVVLGLVEAKESGYTVSQEVLNRGLRYLNGQVLSIVRMTDPYKLNRQAFILYVLARGGRADVSSTVQLYDQRQRMALYAHAFLAQTLHIIDSGDPRIGTLLSDFASTAILSATGTHWEEKASDRWNWNTDTRTTAIVLSALSQIEPENPLNANAVRWLMSHRTNGHWLSTQETAWTLMALTNWMVASGELQADYQYAVALNGQRLGGGVANAETLRQTQTLRVDVSELLTDQANRLAVTRDDGPGNLYYTAHLNVYLPVEQIEPLEQGIIVSRSYYRLEDVNTPVTQASQGELLLGRLTIVAPAALHYVIIDDPLPAGLEAVDQSLSTSPQSVEVPQQFSWKDLWWRGWGWWFFTHTQLKDERVVLSTDYLPAGTYVYTYLVRASSIGVFKTIPPTAQEFYFPEVYGRGAGSLFTVIP
ncbi:MAG: Ig-like domain-containing protein [Chloroflexota bacterium]